MEVKSAKRIQKKVAKGKDVGELYCYKLDIVKFYPSINNNKIKYIVANEIKYKDTLLLLYDIIDSTDSVPMDYSI